MNCTRAGCRAADSGPCATPRDLWRFPQFVANGYCILAGNLIHGSETMTREKTFATASPDFGAWEVEKRVYDALVSGGVVHQREIELCRELAALAGSMYQRRRLSDSEIEEMLYAVARD